MSGITDPIADMLTRVRNALIVKHESVLIPMSKMKFQIAKILKDEGYIKAYKSVENSGFPMLEIKLAYDDSNIPLIQGIKRISKPGLRIYVNKTNIPNNAVFHVDLLFLVV